MKKLTILFALLCASMMGWATDEGVYMGTQNPTYTNQFKWYSVPGATAPMGVDIIQAKNDKYGIYINVGTDLFNGVTYNGTEIPAASLADYYAQQGAGAWFYVDQFTSKCTTVEVTYNGSVVRAFRIQNDNGTGDACTTGGGGGEDPDPEPERTSQCEGDLGHFATFGTKRIHYKIEYLASTNKIRYEVRGYDTQVLDFCQIQTTAGSSTNLSIVNGVAVWKQDAPAAGTEMGILFLYSTDAIGGNEMNAENTSSFTGNNEHLVYYKSHDCEAESEPANAPTTTPDESTIFNDCQIYSILGSDYYSSCGFNNETNPWGGGTATTETIDGREVLHIANSNYLERGFNPHDVSGFTHIHFDVWTQEAMNLRIKLMAYEDGWKEADAQNFTSSAASWKSVDLPLSGFNHSYLNKIQGIYPSNMSQQDIYFTNIYFYKTTDDVACYETLNLAQGKPVVAGYAPGNEGEAPTKANDGNNGSQWTTYSDQDASVEWWYVDLKNNYEINRVEALWGDPWSTNYIIQTRTDAPSEEDKTNDAAWVTIATVENTGAGEKVSDVTGATGRYVRVHSLSKSSNFFRLYELRVFGTGYAITDTNDPEITTAAVADDSENYTSVKLHLVATDVEDGAVKTFMLNKGDDNWLPITTDASDCYTVSELARGHYSYQVKARDHAGRVSAISTINFDILNPADNLALNQPVEAGYATENNDGEAATKANDGNLGTPWATYNNKPMDVQWWSVDLGEVYQLSNVDLFWDVRSNHYLIQVSHAEPADRSDDTQWYTALEVNETQTTGNAEANKNRYAVDATARYIRFKAVTKDGTFLKLWEFRAFGSAYAEADNNAPEITAASVSYDEGSAILTLTATDAEDGAVKSFRVVNTTTGDKKVLTTNDDNQIIIDDLTPNTPYSYQIQAMDKAANLSDVSPLIINVPLSTAENIAEGKPCEAGYEWSNDAEKKEKANDGNTATSWVTYGGESNRDGWWWYVDLQNLYHLKKIELYWPDVYLSSNYKVQVRRDAPSESDKANDAAWTTLATVTDATAGASKSTSVDVVARYVRIRILSDGWFRLGEVRVFADAKIVTLSETSNTTILAENAESTAIVELPRTFPQPSEWYTLCLPFDLSNAQLTAAFGAGYTLAEMVGAEDRGSLIHLNFDYINALEAGKAYLLKPGVSVTESITFEGVTIRNINPASVKSANTYMEFQGTFNTILLNQDNQRFVGPENYLYSPADGGTNMNAFRCYFTIPSSSLAPERPARIVFAEQTPTDVDKVATEVEATKCIENGVLLIKRDGRIYNAQGLLVK